MIVLMTDGIANRPGGTGSGKSYALEQAGLAAERHYPIVTISLGNAADTDLMQQIADATHGVHYNIPGGSSVTDYEDELLAVFRRIADDRPLVLVK
jgi:Mg-chelatase subunit ChlD